MLTTLLILAPLLAAPPTGAPKVCDAAWVQAEAKRVDADRQCWMHALVPDRLGTVMLSWTVDIDGRVRLAPKIESSSARLEKVARCLAAAVVAHDFPKGNACFARHAFQL